MGENMYQRRASDILSWILASLLVLVCLWVGRLSGNVESGQEFMKMMVTSQQESERRITEAHRAEMTELRTVYSEAHAWITVTRVEAAKFGLNLPDPPPRLAETGEDE